MNAQNVLLFIVFGAFFVGLMLFTYGRAYAILDSWAAQNGYEIVEKRQAWLNRGPFFWTSNKNQVVFLVIVRDRHGIQRKGWVRVGHWLFGMFFDQADVAWE